jgi:hypothetical protein
LSTFLVAGGEHDDRRAAVLPDQSAELEAAQAGQHHVEQHEVGPERPDRRQHFEATLDGLHFESSVSEVVG